jgi:heme oxygenase
MRLAHRAHSMPASGTTLAHLDRETTALHDECDRGWRRLLQARDISREEYAQQLMITYGFEAPFEAACAYTPELSSVIDLRGRARSGLIAQDLLALGRTPDQVTRTNTYPLASFQDAAEALGWMYVVERPTLIYDEVRDALATRFYDLSRATMYLSAYEKQASRRRAELGTALDRVSSNDKIRERVIDAARNAFGALVSWHRSHGPMLRSVG